MNWLIFIVELLYVLLINCFCFTFVTHVNKCISSKCWNFVLFKKGKQKYACFLNKLQVIKYIKKQPEKIVRGGVNANSTRFILEWKQIIKHHDLHNIK